jgi:hypothetical protein
MIQRSKTDREVVEDNVKYYTGQIDLDKSRLISIVEGIQIEFLKSLINDMEYHQMKLGIYEDLLEDFVCNDSIRLYEEAENETNN